MRCLPPAEALRLILLTFTASTLVGVSALAAPPAFTANKNGTNQTVVGDTDTLLTWSTEGFDTNNNFASNRFTPTVAGKYLIVVSVQCQQAGQCVPSVRKNGATTIARAQSTDATFGQTPQVSAIVDMNGSTDFIEAFITTAGDMIGGGADRTYFSGMQLDGDGSGGGTGSTMVSGWPDAIQCSDGTNRLTLIQNNYAPSGSGVVYETPNSAVGGSRYFLSYSSAGAYVSQSNLAAYDCVTNAWSISQLYAQNRAFNLAGSGSSQWQSGTGGAIFYNDGNVSIGTTAPLAPLTVVTTSTTDDATTRVAVLGLSNTNMGQLELRSGRDDSAFTNRYSTIQAWSNQLSNPVGLALNPSGGNVGIGTTAPAYKLDVAGPIRGGVAGAGDVLFIGNDTKLVDINVANTAAIYGLQDGAVGNLKLGSAGPTLYGADGNVGIGTASPASRLDVAGTVTATTIVAAPPLMILADERSSGTAAGGCTSGSWGVRTLNTQRTNTIGGASLTSNEFTLPAGTYLIDAEGNTYETNRYQTRLYNVTDAAVTVYGTNVYSAGSSATPTSRIKTVFAIAAPKTFRIEARCNTTKATNGHGVEVNFGGTEVYALVELTKLQ